MPNPGGANRIELESQILSVSLRQSWADTDVTGLLLAWGELSSLFPDLTTEQKDSSPDVENYYDLLEVPCDVNPSWIRAAYFKALKSFLREHPDPHSAENEFMRIVNAGTVLSKNRLRISHDLVATQHALQEGGFDVSEHEVIDTDPNNMEECRPMLVDLLQVSNRIGPIEIQAIKNQWNRYPEIPLTDLVLQAGYVTNEEMKSLMLAEFLLETGRITMQLFESSVGKHLGSDFHFPPDVPPDAARVPLKPKPTGGDSGIALPLPDPPGDSGAQPG